MAPMIPGALSTAEVKQNVGRMSARIPSELWSELKREKLRFAVALLGVAFAVVLALIAARKAGIHLDFDRACAIDLATKGTGKTVLEAVKTSEIDRVGQKLRVDAIAVTDDGGDAAKFASVVKQVVDNAPGVPVIGSLSPLNATRWTLSLPGP